ncbi:hypothetical protein GGQ74_000081 [Desulfobaculum xiamenense]|uniref:Uncharacterized protein n=1 Tax=Desulfobaculum xiamenense TaxID=995050 RepID=A0A846QDR0_9BACT|nr:hypothetical protein [Desulfobaculum xiamenense]NJB66441.1 hypothetical protein [Desulfobaculum xiamenense]
MNAATVMDAVFAQTGRAALYRADPAACGLEVTVRMEHGGRDASGGEAVIKVRVSEVPAEPRNGALFVVNGQTYTVAGICAAPQTTAHVWACACVTGRLAAWRQA